jgi:predicted RNA-binding protein with PUA-like domain
MNATETVLQISKKRSLPSYWLFKSEPDEFGIVDLKNSKGGISRWDGIRNFQARNYIQQDMREDDCVFFYHSSCKQPGIYGSMRVASKAMVDPTAFDKSSPYFDPKSLSVDNPKWFGIDVEFQKEYLRPLLLPRIKELDLGPCPLTARGNRLSIIPLTNEQYHLLEDELDSIQED